VDGEPPGGGPAGPPATRLRQLRAQRGLSQEQLAHLLGVSFATVNRWETGRTQMSARARQALADFEARDSQAEGGQTRDGQAGEGQARDGSRARAASSPAASVPALRAPASTAPLSSGPLSSEPPPPAAAPPAPASPAPSRPALPVAQSSFIGRDRELEDLIGLLDRCRLLTLIGPGGAGKTRLAVEAIGRQRPAVPVAFIPLETVRQPESLITLVAAGLRVPDRAGVPLPESVAAALAEAPRLIVLDGAEHLREAVADLASDLLGAAPGVRVVITSRVVLGAPGEVCWIVPPLECPSAAAGVADIAGSDAVQLFVARARERLPGFSVADLPPHAIGELCRRLDGLPLAIELIAGWVGALSVREILQQRAVLLDSPGAAAPSLGRRLVDVVQASYDLLRPEERRLLAVLSVFAGSFTLADVQGVGDAGPALPHLIRGLVDSSWLVVTRGSEHNRFSMLDTMRTFAAARLAESGTAPEVRQRHARHFAALAQGSETGLAGPEAAEWTARLAASTADLHQALLWSQEQGDIRLGLDMGAALWRWWLLRGRLRYGRDWLGRLLARAGHQRDEPAGRAFCSAAVLAAENGDYAEAVRQARLALRILEPLGVPDRTATAATVLGSAYRYLGDRPAARRSFATAMELRGGLGDRRALSAALNNMALLEVDDGDLARARDLFEQALAIKRQLGDRHSLAIGLANLGDLLTRINQWEAADRVLAEASTLAADLGNPQLMGTVRCNQGNVAAYQRQWAEAAAHYAAAVAAYQEAGHGHDAVEALTGLGRVSYHLGRPDEGAQHLLAAQALAGELGNPERLAQVRAALAETGGTAAGPLPGGLTPRQAEVLRLLAAGMSNKQIAAELYLSPSTVERHLATTYRKLGLTGRVEAARYALAHGLAATVTRALL
jgi:predicted ATPase/DNA-binding NarL/FixJ family response regulator/DNA-binding XRE family transcriptional regulator